MTAAQYAALIGQHATINIVRGVGTLVVEVVIDDVANYYGNVRYLVRPVAGSGKAWVEHLTLPQTPVGEE